MSRIELGEFRATPEDVPLADLLEESIRIARGYAQGGPAIDPASGAAGWIVRVDRRAIRQVPLNLLSNAAKFTPRAGHVGVEVTPAGEGGLDIRVSDTGYGISPERLKTIFEPFQESTAEHARVGRGAGLGLWLSRSLIELHGGALRLESRQGEGTVVTVTIPASRVVLSP
jgi:two-component system cell cycle sensor histidine kinase PleC